MINKETIIKATNRTDGSLGYTVQDLGIRRRYEPGETKEVTFEELQKLSASFAGMAILREDLFIDNEEAVNYLLHGVEPEYYYTISDVETLLTTGSLDQLLDALDFGPEGVTDLIKTKAVQLEISDLAKRKAILDKTGFDVSRAIEINRESQADDINIDTGARSRRAAPVTSTQPAAEPQGRRYSVVK